VEPESCFYNLERWHFLDPRSPSSKSTARKVLLPASLLKEVGVDVSYESENDGRNKLALCGGSTTMKSRQATQEGKRFFTGEEPQGKTNYPFREKK